MKKKELLKCSPMQITKEMRREAQRDVKAERYNASSIIVPAIAWFYRARKAGERKDILEVDIFTNKWIREGIEEPRYRIFLQDGRYDTYDGLTERWRTSTIEKLEYGASGEYYEGYWYMYKIPWIKETERKLVIDFTANESKEPRSAIQIWQAGTRHRKEMSEIDEEMALVPELPKDFEDWTIREAAGQYLFYDAGPKVKEGYCTHCGHIVPITHPKYNMETKCPHCRHNVTYKSRKKSGNIGKDGRVGLLQKTETGYVYRIFRYIVRYQNGIRVDGHCGEIGRAVYSKDLKCRHTYRWDRWKQTELMRWCYDYGKWYNEEEVTKSCSALYWRNLKKVLKGSRLEYSALWILAKNVRNVYPTEWIYRYKEHVEKLIKCGFYRLAETEATRGYVEIDYLERRAKGCKRILDLRGDYYQTIAGKDPNVNEYHMLHQLQECGIRATWEDVRHLAAVSKGRNMAIYIRHTTVHRMRRYLKEVLKDKPMRVMEYHDYLQMAAGLGYDLTDEWVLFPKKMEERHAQLVEEQREKKEKMQRMKDLEKTREYKKMVKKLGWKHYEMETDKFMIRLPENLAEIREEGNQMHHCVAGYIDQVAAGETCILFVREKTKEEEPFYTMEVKNGEVIQCRGKFNGKMTEPVQKLVENFKKKKLRQRKAG